MQPEIEFMIELLLSNSLSSQQIVQNTSAIGLIEHFRRSLWSPERKYQVSITCAKVPPEQITSNRVDHYRKQTNLIGTDNPTVEMDLNKRSKVEQRKIMFQKQNINKK